jgi:muconolactone delta-isomerase
MLVSRREPIRCVSPSSLEWSEGGDANACLWGSAEFPRSEAAGRKAGVVIDIWKCVGTRRVMAVANVDSLDTLDQILLDLPIMKEHGQHVQIDVTPLRRLEDFATDLKKRA